MICRLRVANHTTERLFR